MNLHIVIQITISASISRIYFAAQKPFKGHMLSKHRTREVAGKKRILHSLASKRIYYPPLGEVGGAGRKYSRNKRENFKSHPSLKSGHYVSMYHGMNSKIKHMTTYRYQEKIIVNFGVN